MVFKVLTSLASRIQRSFVIIGSKLTDNPVWSKYCVSLAQRPLLTKSITSGVIMGAGDALCQSYFTSKFDYERFAKYSFLGSVLVGPSTHFWYGFLSRRIPGLGFTTVVYRVALDQLCFSPVFIAFFMSAVLLLEGKPEQVG